MSLRRVQDVSVWMLQALHRDFHRGAVDVDPPRRTTGQEGPGDGRGTTPSYMTYLIYEQCFTSLTSVSKSP